MRYIEIEQIGSPIRRRGDQRKALIGLKLNKIGRVSWLSGPVIASRPHVVWHPLDQHPALKSPQGPFHQLRCRVSAE